MEYDITITTYGEDGDPKIQGIIEQIVALQEAGHIVHSLQVGTGCFASYFMLLHYARANAFELGLAVEAWKFLLEERPGVRLKTRLLGETEELAIPIPVEPEPGFVEVNVVSLKAYVDTMLEHAEPGWKPARLLKTWVDQL